MVDLGFIPLVSEENVDMGVDRYHAQMFSFKKRVLGHHDSSNIFMMAVHSKQIPQVLLSYNFFHEIIQNDHVKPPIIQGIYIFYGG